VSVESTQVILTGSLVLITAYYAWQTRKTVKTMNAANEANNRPVVSIGLKERDESISFLNLVVLNAGKGLARDIAFEVEGDNFTTKEVGQKKEKIKGFRVIKNGVRSLAPGESRSHWFMSIMGRIDEIQKINTTIKLTYFNSDKSRKYTDSFRLDFLSLPEYSLGNEPIYKISKEMEKVCKELEQIRRGLKK